MTRPDLRQQRIDFTGDFGARQPSGGDSRAARCRHSEARRGAPVRSTINRVGLMAVNGAQGFRYDLIRAAHRRAAEVGVTDMTDVHPSPNGPADRCRRGRRARQPQAHRRRSERRRWRGLSAETMLAPAMSGSARASTSMASSRATPSCCAACIPHEFRLSGHSDADAPLHAVTDAILGAIGEGDIGIHFLRSAMARAPTRRCFCAMPCSCWRRAAAGWPMSTSPSSPRHRRSHRTSPPWKKTSAILGIRETD